MAGPSLSRSPSASIRRTATGPAYRATPSRVGEAVLSHSGFPTSHRGISSKTFYCHVLRRVRTEASRHLCAVVGELSHRSISPPEASRAEAPKHCAVIISAPKHLSPKHLATGAPATPAPPVDSGNFRPFLALTSVSFPNNLVVCAVNHEDTSAALVTGRATTSDAVLNVVHGFWEIAALEALTVWIDYIHTESNPA